MSSEIAVKIKEYDFKSDSIPDLSIDPFVDENWPLVYILSDKDRMLAYIGETANAKNRMITHLKHAKKGKLKTLQIITSDKFNKSATLDIESNLIKYISGDGKYKLLNANLGLANHTYYQKKDVYWRIFKHVWEQLRKKGITDHSLEQINNSDLFKYSPYKSLENEQIDSIHKICQALLDKDKTTILIEGGAGTGKTILATYLFKLLNTELADLDFDEFETEGDEFLKTVAELKKRYPKPSMALVVSMTSFRKTMKAVFRNVKGLSSNMVIGPTQLAKKDFDELKDRNTTASTKLWSQFRVKGGNDYVRFIKNLLNCSLGKQEEFLSEDYEFLLFESVDELISKIKEKEKEQGLSRLVAGFSWEWISKKNKSLYDIEIEGVKLRWNTVAKDWINSENSKNEVGCIHTTQGYDLNYIGVIFGHEIAYDPKAEEIFIKRENYYDKKGLYTIDDPEVLKEYIINIYRTIMLRGIKGTFVYACDLELRKYLKHHIPIAIKESELIIYSKQEINPYEDAVPVYNIKVAAGYFSDSHIAEEIGWSKLPEQYTPNEEYFVCQVNGESMNKRIPNGSWCLFKKYTGGSREGKIVLVQHEDIHEPDFGAGYTVKKYTSTKSYKDDNWRHSEIILKPLSLESKYEEIILNEAQGRELKTIGLFIATI
ncbi:MAG: DUF2075 domain-containing protein [Balneola sp.]|jgi:DUF2075 family protein/predicted GIY-YIG superfamily endonuclease